MRGKHCGVFLTARRWTASTGLIFEVVCHGTSSRSCSGTSRERISKKSCPDYSGQLFLSDVHAFALCSAACGADRAAAAASAVISASAIASAAVGAAGAGASAAAVIRVARAARGRGRGGRLHRATRVPGCRRRGAGVLHVIVRAVVPVVTRGRGHADHDGRAVVVTMVLRAARVVHVRHGAAMGVTAVAVVVRGAVVAMRCVRAALRRRCCGRGCRGRRARVTVVTTLCRRGCGGLGRLALLTMVVLAMMVFVVAMVSALSEGTRAEEGSRDHDESSDGEFFVGRGVHGFLSSVQAAFRGQCLLQWVERCFPLSNTQTRHQRHHSKFSRENLKDALVVHHVSWREVALAGSSRCASVHPSAARSAPPKMRLPS